LSEQIDDALQFGAQAAGGLRNFLMVDRSIVYDTRSFQLGACPADRETLAVEKLEDAPDERMSGPVPPHYSISIAIGIQLEI
jgi:hypothetical protein